MIGIVGKKVSMTQIFDKDGMVIPVTLVKAGPCTVVQKKTIEKDGYDAIQVGLEEISSKKVSKPLAGHFKKHGGKAFRYLKEFRLDVYKDVEEGEILDVSMFTENEMVKVTAYSKGKGFAGVMKRHGFSGHKASHGAHETFRGSGSIGQCATPSRVFKGLRMAGRKGVEKNTVLGSKIVKLDLDKNIIFIKGSVPGHRNTIVTIKKEL